MARGWVKDMTYEILPPTPSGNRDDWHWRHNQWPSYARVHGQYRRCMSFNFVLNFFEPDSNGYNVTNFGDYYSSSISLILARFADRFKDTVPFDAADDADWDEKEILRKRTHEIGTQILQEAAQKARSLGSLPMKTLYTQDFYNQTANRANILEVLEELDIFRRVVQWVCIPFLDYPRHAINPGDTSRPTEHELGLHLAGYSGTGVAPTLPDGVTRIAGPMLALDGINYKDLVYLHPRDQDGATSQHNAISYASAWGFFDPKDVVERSFHVRGFKYCPENLPGCAAPGTVGPLSSGNGYRCVGGLCQPSNPSAFCVHNPNGFC